MADINEFLVEYVKGGGLYPQALMRGYADAGRFGVSGEGAGVPADHQDAYRLGAEQAQKDRAASDPTPWVKSAAPSAAQ